MTVRAVPVATEPVAELLDLDGEEHVRISGYDRLPPFLMSVPSESDLWAFLSSGGGLTAGRTDADGCLFPYETVDRLHDGHHHTGPVTLLRLGGDRGTLWVPFAGPPADGDGGEPGSGPDRPAPERRLWKNVAGNRVTFEEIRPDLGLALRARWTASDDLGFVRTVTIENRGERPVELAVLDGFRNVLPWGVPLRLQQQSSCLADAYKRADRDPDTTLAVFSLTSRILDRPEAAEELRANVAWCHGLPSPRIHLSAGAIDAFRRGDPPAEDRVRMGGRGSYLVTSSLTLGPGATARWHVVADIGLGHAAIASLRTRLLSPRDGDAAIGRSLDRARDTLVRTVASADGLQLTGRREADVHHFADVLFNVMRGGVFADGVSVPVADLADFLRVRNGPVADRQAALLETLPSALRIDDLLATAERTGDADFRRLCLEYLPLRFSRRHGDPSRPWNRFSIRVRNADGSPALRWEGNWRDIFQNWEALALGYPAFLPSLVAKFVNASTIDGFNPYRLTRDGVDWEVPDPADPWACIGYWGDHQIVYLLRLLEATHRASPGALEAMLRQEIFSYADVPYRLAGWSDIVANPRATVTYDRERAARIDERVRARGTDGKLVAGPDGEVLRVNLLEKLLVPVLAKLSSLAPGGGLWMNTQRPEWNDANNALAGDGLSVVTVCHLRRHLDFLAGLLDRAGDAPVPVEAGVAEWLREVEKAIDALPSPLPPGEEGERARRRFLEAVGRAFERYRGRAYDRLDRGGAAEGVDDAAARNGHEPARGTATDRVDLAPADVAAFCRAARAVLDDTIRGSRRPDGLYHSYNLLSLREAADRAVVRPLDEMLEGQVAALSSGLVGAAEAARLVETMFVSRLHHPDRNSFLLYPYRQLPPFLERNRIPDGTVDRVPLLRELLAEHDASVIERDASGICRFHPDFANAADVAVALDRLAERPDRAAAVERDRQAVLDAFEAVFDHRSFTGRSGRMYGYEGIGCVYWHLVAKLLLAVQEVTLRAERDGEPPELVAQLRDLYFRIRAGLGFEKTVREYGAFPTDPYSHTPPDGGARQPGMTGQVKEEILARFGELGVEIRDGIVGFRPRLLQEREVLSTPAVWRFPDPDGRVRVLEIPARSLAFGLCQVPVIYRFVEGEESVRVELGDGTTSARPGRRLDAASSRALLGRTGRIARIEVDVPRSALVGTRADRSD